jgi:hypothetical protein
MKAVTKYQADDGRLFDSESAAIEHEFYLSEIEGIEKALPPRPDDGCKFENGDGYLQHTQESVDAFKREILMLAARRLKDPKLAEWAKKPQEVHGFSYVGRLLDDCDRHLYGLWSRVMCMDEKNREWGQPYFALNPGTGKDFPIAA